MVAVFMKERDFRELELRPKHQFKRIHMCRDLNGIKFTGVILGYHWWEVSRELQEAHYLLKQCQPELFKNE